MRFGHNFWPRGPIDTSQRVWISFCMIFSGILYSTIIRAPKYVRQTSQICHIWLNKPNMVPGAFIWTRKKWSSGVSLKRSCNQDVDKIFCLRSCKTQFRLIDLLSIGPPQSKLITKSHFPIVITMWIAWWTWFLSIFW